MQHNVTAPPQAGHPISGVIYESGIGNGYAYTRVAYDADAHTVIILYSCGTMTTLDAGRLGDTMLAWAARCHECRAGLWPDMRLGPVGERLADRYVEYCQKASA